MIQPQAAARQRRALAGPSLLSNISRAQAMVVYGCVYTGTSRASRFSAPKLGKAVANLIDACIGCIPVEERADAIYGAMDIMCGGFKRI